MINLRKDVGLLNNLETTKTLGTLQVALNAVFIMRWLDPLGARGRLWFEYEMSSLARLAFWMLSSKLLRWSLLVRSWWLWAGSWRLHLALVLTGLCFPYVAKWVTPCHRLPSPWTPSRRLSPVMDSSCLEVWTQINIFSLVSVSMNTLCTGGWTYDPPISASWELGTR